MMLGSPVCLLLLAVEVTYREIATFSQVDCSE